MSNLTSLLHYGSLLARSDVEPIEPSEVPFWVSEYTMLQKFQVATVTVLVYDARILKTAVSAKEVITLDKEVKYFWKLPRKAVDYVFFLNRYVGIFGAVANIVSNFSLWTRTIANWVTITSIDYILMIRVLALYSQDRRLSTFLLVSLGLDTLLKLGLVFYLEISQHIAVGSLAKNATVCGQDNVTPWQLGMVDWLIPLVYGTILMVLALWKAVEFWKMSTGFKGFRLVKILIQDQVWYFTLVIACCVFATLQFKVAVSNEFLSAVLAQLGNPSFLTILGGRLLFNMKEAGERGLNGGTSCNTQSGTVSDIAFAEPANPQRQSQTNVEEGTEET